MPKTMPKAIPTANTAKIIQKFLKDRGYKSYYWNMYKINGRLRIDVGSWTEFFFIEGSEEELNEYFC